MRKVLKFVKGKREDKKEHGSTSRSTGPFSDHLSAVDQLTPTDEHCTGLEQGFGYYVDLSGKDKTITKLHKAAWQGNLEKLKVNMKKIDMNVADRLNRTPLHFAAAQGHANIVWFLLGNKANFNICDNEGKTPFLKAVECGHKETIQIMLERGVDINTIDYSGNSGLHIAAKQGFYEITSTLLKQGANFESSNNFGEFPLHIATKAEHKDLVELLLRYGSSVNIVDRDNRSPLMFAAKCGSMALVQLFLEYGAQRGVMDSNDWTAEDYALMGGHQDIAAELKSPSERMVMSFTEKSIESQRCTSGIAPSKRSVSDAFLPPDQQEHEKEDTNFAEKQNEEADNSDTWNDSQLSDCSLKQKGAGLKLTKFLPPSSDDEISEESIHSPRVQEMKDEEIQDSPRSCVIPPPCKPPRSWDLIQSGVIDDPKVLEPRRRSLLPLGSLKSRRESFNESPSAAESPSFHGDNLHTEQGDADQWHSSQSFRKSDDRQDALTRHLNLSENEENRDSPSTKYEGIQVKENNSQLHKEKKEGSPLVGAGGGGMLDDIRSSKESLKGSSSNSDWDSDDSLPLDNYSVANVTISPADTSDSPLKVFRVINPSELDVPDATDDTKDGSPYSLNAEKKSRFLTRAPSIDLTDDDVETGKRKFGHSPEASELERHDEIDVNCSISGTLGRDGTLLGYEEVWESNAHIQKSNVTLSGPSLSAGDTHISIKEEFEETLVWSSPQIEGNSKGLACLEHSKEESENWNIPEDTLLYPSPRFDKAKSTAVSENDVHMEGARKQTSMDDADRRNGGLKLESRSLDALEPEKFVPDARIPHTKKHARQQSISLQSWNRSEEMRENPPSAANIDRMIEENQRINAQLRCYDEALRDLAHVSVVRKQSSLSLPRAKETSGLTRSQSAGSKNEGFISLPSANDFGPREMAQSAIVKKQGSLSLPRTSEIPDFTMVQSLGPKKQGHSSLPCTNEFGIREMAQTAIVKRQGSLSLPRRCEIPDFASAANEEYLSLPRSNELIDEAFKEIGQSSVTMKRGSHSLPRSIDAKLISLGADPVPPPRHKKLSHRRRRAESEGEASDRTLKDSVGRSRSFDVKTQSSIGTEPIAAIVKSPVESEVTTESIGSPNRDEKPHSERVSSNGSVKEGSLEKPIRKKRKMLLAMRGFLGQNLKNLNGSTVSELSVEDSFDEHPFLMNTDKGGPLERQVTVIERPSFSLKGDNSMMLSPVRLEVLAKQELQQQSPVKQNTEIIHDTQPSSSLPEEVPLHVETASGNERDDDQILPDTLQKASPETLRDSQSDDAESGLSYSDNTPQHVYTQKGHHNLLKQHLQKATAEKARLEENAAELGERAEKLKYELAEAHEATRSRDEVIALLEDQLNHLETMYTKSLEESHKYKLRLGNLEQELKHLKEVCCKHEDEKAHLTEIIRLKELEKNNLDKSLTSKDEEKMRVTGEKAHEQKHQELESLMNYLETEKNKLKEEVHKLETKNGDLMQKLDAVITRNQILSEEKAAKNSLDITTLQEHSEKWKQLHETCIEKLQMMGSCRPSVDSEAQISNTLQEYFSHEVQQIILTIEEAKEKDYVIWHNKIQEDVLNAIHLLNAEYSRAELSLLKHNEQLELVINRLLEDLPDPFSKQAPHDESSKETGTAYKTLKLLEELMLLNSELKDQCLQLRIQLEHRQEELRRKLETMRPSSDTSSRESSKTEEELREENILLKQQIPSFLSQSPQNLRELWCELKHENAKLKEQIGILLKQTEPERGIEVVTETNQRDGEHAENVKKQMAELQAQMKTSECYYDKGVMTNLTMFAPVKKIELNEEDELKHTIERNTQEQETVTSPIIWEQNPNCAQVLLLELRNENVRLQRQIDLLLEHIRDQEDMIHKETMTETDTGTIQSSDQLLMENLQLKQQIILLTEKVKQNIVTGQDTVPELVACRCPEQYSDLLNMLKIENQKLKDQVDLLDLHLKGKGAVEDRGIMTDPLECKEEQKCKDEDTKLEPDLLLLQSKCRQQNKEFRDGRADFGVVLEEDESCACGATCNSSKINTVVSDRHCSHKALPDDQNMQEIFNEKSTDQKVEVVEKLLTENRELNLQLEAVKFELEEFHTKTMMHEVQPLKTEIHSVQTMTDPDIELVRVSMENASLQAQLQQVSKECKKRKEDLERTLILLRESRESSSILLKEAQDTNAYESTLLKKELEEVKRKVKHEEQEMVKSRISTIEEHQQTKITELCNLLDHLRKENADLQAQIKRMLTDRHMDMEVPYGCQNLQQNHGTSRNLSAVANKNLDSLAHLLSVGCSVSLEDAQHRTQGIKADNVETVDLAMQAQGANVFAVNGVPTANQKEPKSSVRTNDRSENELNFSNISLLNKEKQNSQSGENKSRILINANRRKQELQNTNSAKSQLSRYPGPSVHITGIGNKTDKADCYALTENSQNPSLLTNKKIRSEDGPSESYKDQAQGDCAPKLSVMSAHGSGSIANYQQIYKDNNGSSSEVFLDMACCQNQMLCGLSSESTISDLGSVSQEPACRANYRQCRDAATNTTPSVQNVELQRELQLEKDKCRKYQQNIKKLKSDIQLLKNKLGESRKQGKIESNLVLKQNNTDNNNSLLTGIQSPTHYDPNISEFQRQVAELEQKVQEENSMRFSLEVQINKMRYELQEKLQLEKELNILHSRLEKDFVSRYELEKLRNSYEVALSHAKYEAEVAARDDLNEKLCQISTFIEKQVQEQTRLSQLRNTTEAHMKQDFQETRLKLLSELAKVQASLQSKGEEEKELREKCEKLTRECEKKHEIRKKKLIEKSYSVNLAPNSNLKEKELNSKGMLDIRSPVHQSGPVQAVINPISSPAVAVTAHVAEHPFSHILRRELERSIRKHTRTDSLSEHPSSSCPQTASEEHLELLKKKYFLH